MLIKVGKIDKVGDLTTGGNTVSSHGRLLAVPAIENGSVIPKWSMYLVVGIISHGDGRLA